jgi:hypothetical protein
MYRNCSERSQKRSLSRLYDYKSLLCLVVESDSLTPLTIRIPVTMYNLILTVLNQFKTFLEAFAFEPRITVAVARVVFQGLSPQMLLRNEGCSLRWI